MVQLERRILRDAKGVDFAHAEHRAATGNNRPTVSLQERGGKRRGREGTHMNTSASRGGAFGPGQSSSRRHATGASS
jgi:hypothetical protein